MSPKLCKSLENVGVFGACVDGTPTYDGIEYTTSWLMTMSISSNDAEATKLPMIVTVGCPPGFGLLLWEGV